MPTPRALKSLSSGVLGSFISRNNDVGGYWGIGLLCRIASESRLASLSFDLMVSPASAAASHPVIAALAAKYGQMLQIQAEKHGFTSVTLTRAILSIEFGTSGHLPTPPPLARGNPFFVTLAVLDAHGRSSKVFLTSRSEPHDPSKEHRNTRAPTTAPPCPSTDSAPAVP
ncbi:MAG TPA: hypothetical protein VD994_11935 [Prosthecobacter sp.]|nr:hypothetical protein [Prosthecobacter sp.]